VELQAVAREGKRIRTAHLEVRTVASPLGHPRLGLVVPKGRKTGVARNQLKRRLRELARTRLLPGAPPVDIVIRTRWEAYDASFEALQRDVDRARREIERAWGVGRAASGAGSQSVLPPRSSADVTPPHDTPPTEPA